MQKDWIKLGISRKKKDRDVYTCKCQKCGKIFSNHRSMRAHKNVCKGNLPKNQKTIDFEPQVIESEAEEIPKVSLFQKYLIELFIGANIALYQIAKPCFLHFLSYFEVPEDDIPSPYMLRKSIIQYTNQIK